ncbi:DUF221-domain-containing protein, partial [Aureobasidium melanogenum]
MAANTPPLSWKEHYDQQYNHLVQIRFNKICSERDSAITINKQLRNANSGCWHIIANKQLEIDALHAKVAALHGTNRRLQQDLNTERQTIRNIRDMTGNGSERVTRQNTSPQHNTPTPATKKPREVINTDDLLVSTSKDYPKDDTTTPDDVTADPETGPQVIENDNAEVPQPASKKKRKKWTKVVVENTSAAKRPRREPKPAVQPKAAGVSQAADVSIPKFFVSHMNEIVNEDGEPLSEDIQADFRQQMDELSTKTTSPKMVFNDQRVLKTDVLGDMIEIMGEGDNRGGSSSYNKLVFTVVPLLIVAIPMVLAFLYLRQKQHRIYAPRTFLNTLEEEEKTPKPAYGMFNWISAFRKLPDQYVLNHQTLDNYLFIRYFRMLTYICLVGTIITWVFLLRVNYNGGGSQSELDMFTFSNVSDPNKLYWHAVCAWLFLGFVMFVITKETLYYINLRQAYLTTPRNATRMSTRVVLFTGVPPDMRHEKWIKADFFGVKRVWLATDCTELEKLVNNMNDTAIALEESEIQLSTIATKKHLKGENHFANDPERAGTATQQWIAAKERPSKRIAMVGRRLDAIEMYREQLKAVIPKVEALQKRHVQGYEKLLPAAFVEFETQRAAQLAYSDPFWKQPGKMEAATIGISSPNEIVWPNLAIGKPERWARTIIANTIVILLIVFWSVPVGLVGSLADIDNLAQTFPPLGFVNKLPSSTKGAIGGLLPTLLISAILALVPIICRFTARKAGSITLAQIELRTQGWYFAFQVVQVFLITTFSSGASTVAKQIWNNPGQAPKLLADNLPTASTFYLSFFILQGVAVTASTIFQIVPFLIFNVLAPFLDTTPRRKFERFVTLTGLSWGDTYPKFTLFAVIAISYSCIAPLVLGFAMLGIYFLYLAFRYNVFYVLTMALDTKGDAYGRALQHLSVGIYLAEICLIGLMGARGADGPAKLMVVLLVLTAIYQTYLNMILAPLTNTLSDKLMAENEEEALVQADEEGATAPIDMGGNGVQPKQIAPYSNNKAANAFVEHFKRGGLFAPFLFNGSKSNYPALRRQLWDAFPGQPAPAIPEETLKHAYHHPAITAKPPKLWIVKDELGVSTQEIKETKKVIDISDEGARFNEKGKIEWDEDDVRKAPIWKDRVEY